MRSVRWVAALICVAGVSATVAQNTFPSNGSVCIGATNPGATFEVNGTGIKLTAGVTGPSGRFCCAPHRAIPPEQLDYRPPLDRTPALGDDAAVLPSVAAVSVNM